MFNRIDVAFPFIHLELSRLKTLRTERLINPGLKARVQGVSLASMTHYPTARRISNYFAPLDQRLECDRRECDLPLLLVRCAYLLREERLGETNKKRPVAATLARLPAFCLP